MGRPRATIADRRNTVAPERTRALSITGDPESASGATWTLDRHAGRHDRRSPGHPAEAARPRTLPRGRAQSRRRQQRPVVWPRARSVMRTWGLVCIAANYTHARGAPLGAPGTLLEQGASPANVFRAHAAVTVLARLGYVDVRRVAAHGHSMGAFVTTAFVAAYPADVRVASHTAGGVLLDAIHRRGHAGPERRGGPTHPDTVSVAPRPPGLRRPVPPRSDASTPCSPRPMRAISIPASVTRRRRRSRGAVAYPGLVRRARPVLIDYRRGDP